MPFAYSEFVDLALHWQAGFFARYLKRLPSDHYITQFKKNGVILNTVRQQDGQSAVCRICGFNLASLHLSEGWIIETCSHYGLHGLIDNSGGKSLSFDKWMRQLVEIPIGNSEEGGLLTIKVISFGYKSGPPPEANMLFDLRFLDNPYWVDELRPLTGLDKPVQNYVLEQQAAKEFLACFSQILEIVLTGSKERNTEIFTIALGCTGGQHRSVSIAEHIGKILKEKLSGTEHLIEISHREITEKRRPADYRPELATREQKP